MMRREESAYVAFGQYWLQARQQENTRLWMTNSISAVFAALLAVIAWQGLAFWYIAAFGLSLALFGFFINHTLRVLTVRYSRVASALMDSELGLGDYRRFVEGGDKKGIRGAWETLWSVHIAYVIFYAFGVGGTMEDLQFSPRGRVKDDIEAGRFNLDGEQPIQPDGGLKCFGHPIGASGLRMMYEMYKQLQGKAQQPERQLKNPKIGLTHNMGGFPAMNVVSVAIVGL